MNAAGSCVRVLTNTRLIVSKETGAENKLLFLKSQSGVKPVPAPQPACGSARGGCGAKTPLKQQQLLSTAHPDWKEIHTKATMALCC